MYTNLIYTSQKTHLPFKANYLTLLREIMRVFFCNAHTVCREDEEFQNVQARGTFRYHCT
jgi:hypothetical protein